MKKFQVTMVNPQQIVQKNLKGCKTTKQVTQFAQKHNVPWTWYKPTPNYKVMLVDWPGFKTAWKENGTYIARTPNTKTTVKNNHVWNNKSTRPVTKANPTTSYKANTGKTSKPAVKTTYKTAYNKPTVKAVYKTAGKNSYRTNTYSVRPKRAA